MCYQPTPTNVILSTINIHMSQHHPHHQHIRKRVHQKHETFPHPDKLKNFVDHLIYIIGAFVPLMSLIQSSKIWSEHNAAGISLVAYSGYVLANLVWLFYGILHKEKPIMFMYTLLFFINMSIVIGAFLYG